MAEKLDFVTELAELNLYIVIENIIQHAGYDATMNMLCVSKTWNSILLDIGLWRRLLDRRMINDGQFRRLCSLNGWLDIVQEDNVETKTLAYIFFASTDLKEMLKCSKPENVQQIKTYDFINTLLLHGKYLICGMINGRIKVWYLSDDTHAVESTSPKLLEGHTKSVFAMSARDHFLISASGGQDKTIRIWDLESSTQIHSVLYENALNCQKMELTKDRLVLWYMSEAVINRAFRARGELVMWNVPSVWQDMTLDDNMPFNGNARHERVKIGDVSELYSAVAYPTYVTIFENTTHNFMKVREMHLEEDHWVYLMKVSRNTLLTVYRKGEENVHGLLDDIIQVFDIKANQKVYNLHWKWTLFSPLKSAFMTPFGIVATNTSERAFFWHWEDLPENFEKTRSIVDVAPSRQSNFVMQWRHRINAAMNVRGVALVNEQRSHIYLLQH
ncbi:hypothetical protein TCAL_12174 [Tigriopus californicus]|uniref:Uncharacterized protein n=1 Tax=Tigriopus californicus TaxID=6832 RepID=A0A553P262_TIGCA|nr:uncharacterized protein LOC131883133 isoform X2 [Tigriopus californicus]TRY71773.1 hypothetical protein TCAL_12174 [Tigriopus californicus]|eukprot:TCALIF_12174-PA protein Name:"Similar to FBXW11 F-box/WD repeat-containing protein 11 (Homo sapiens)" AED:0.28 eAED:0.28 QI:143/1/1/1/1/1/2/234/443